MKLGNGLWEHTIFNNRLQPTQIGLGTSSVDSSTLGLTHTYGMTSNNGNLLTAAYAGGGLSDRYGDRWIDFSGTPSLTFNAANNRITNSGYTYDASGEGLLPGVCRRFMSDLKIAYARGFVSRLPCHNSILAYFRMSVLRLHLVQFIIESSIPMKTVEKYFSIDSTGFSTSRLGLWVDFRSGRSKVAAWGHFKLWQQSARSQRKVFARRNPSQSVSETLKEEGNERDRCAD